MIGERQGQWRPAEAGFMREVRGSHTATLLPSGHVLVAGGTTESKPATTSAEIYDPLNLPPSVFSRADGELVHACLGRRGTS
jgi:hypothetical protein